MRRRANEQAERPFIKVHHRVLDETRSGTDFAVWVLIAAHRRYSDPEAEMWPMRETIQRGLGHQGADPKTITLATQNLVKLGLLAKRYDHRSSKSRLFYSIPLPDKPYEQLDQALMGWLASGRLTPENLLWFARWQRACGRKGQTTDSCWEMAQRYKATMRTVERHRAALVSCGLLANVHRAGRSSLTLSVDLAELLTDDPWRDVPSEAWPAPVNADTDPWPMLTAASSG